MRRSKQQIPDEEAREILLRATNGVLSLIDSSGVPYGVPMSFIYNGAAAIYFHCGLSGRKIDCINYNPHGCFTVIYRDEIHPDEFTTYYKSVIAEGVISIIKDREDIIEALRLLSAKYSPGIDCEPEIDKGINHVLILKMDINTLSGKEAIELTRKRGMV